MAHHISRRSFVAGTATALAGAAVPLALAQSADAATRAATPSVASLRRTSFTPLVGSKFSMSDGRVSTQLVLSKVADLQPTTVRADPNSFSLTFTGPGSSPRPQGVYTLANTRLGTVSLLVVPVNLAGASQLYQVIVNRQ